MGLPLAHRLCPFRCSLSSERCRCESLASPNRWAAMSWETWLAGASIETTLELCAFSLRDVKARVRPLFTQQGVAESAGLFRDGLLGDERRKAGWMRAERPAILAPGACRPDWASAHWRGCVARYCRQPRGRASGGRRRGSGDRRDPIPQAGPRVVLRRAAIYRISRQDNQVPDRPVPEAAAAH